MHVNEGAAVVDEILKKIEAGLVRRRDIAIEKRETDAPIFGPQPRLERLVKCILEVAFDELDAVQHQPVPAQSAHRGAVVIIAEILIDLEIGLLDIF